MTLKCAGSTTYSCTPSKSTSRGGGEERSTGFLDSLKVTFGAKSPLPSPLAVFNSFVLSFDGASTSKFVYVTLVGELCCCCRDGERLLREADAGAEEVLVQEEVLRRKLEMS